LTQDEEVEPSEDILTAENLKKHSTIDVSIDWIKKMENKNA